MWSRLVVPFAALVAVFALTPGLFAQNNQHDITGVWRMLNAGQTTGRNSVFPSFSADNRPPLTAWGQEKWSKTRPSGQKPPLSFIYVEEQKEWNDPIFVCDPAGYPRVGAGNTNYRFAEVDGDVVHFVERDHFYRDLWTDGRKLPGPGAKPRWYGYSVARWEGDTLVVESSGFDDRTWLNRAGSIHSDEMRLEERYKILDHDHIEFFMTLNDP